MKYSLKNYQRDAVDKIKAYMDVFLKERNGHLVFKAPTGSGKTFMMSSFFEEIANELEDKRFCVIWVCPGKGELHKQSFDNVDDYLGGNPKCSLLESDFFGSRDSIHNHEIVFVNWEKLISKDRATGRWKNNLMKDQEGNNFLNVIENTKNNGILIILLVDESHIGSSHNSRISEFRDEIIVPDIDIEMSATPLSRPNVEIDVQDVIFEGMIKEGIIVNEGITAQERRLKETDSEQIVLEKGYEKFLEIKEAYKDLNINVNPLVLVQIPNTEAGEDKKLIIKDFLLEKGITEDNGKLKLWCDNQANFDKKKIKNNNDETEFLIFKTAVATGWDCPRAHILIKFRESNSETFEIQTIGRILRTAEAKSYDNLLLDNAYIYTNIENFETKKETYNPNAIKTLESKLIKGVKPEQVNSETKLISYYRSRKGNYNSADSRFSKYYEEVFCNFFNLTNDNKYKNWTYNETKFKEKSCNMNIDVNLDILKETAVNTVSADNEMTITNDTVLARMSNADVNAKYNEIIKNNLSGLAYVRSKSPINSAIISTFDKFYLGKFTREVKVSCYQRIVVNNESIFNEILSNSTNKFRQELCDGANNVGDRYNFKFEIRRNYSEETHKELISKKSIYQPLYVAKRENSKINELEKEFLNYLDSKEEVKWYFENGPEHMRINFGIAYNNGVDTFRPDFIVKFKNGTVGIFDTKPIDYRVDDTKIKSEALIKYISDTNFNRGHNPKVVGGIVVKYNSVFYYYDKVEYHDFKENSEDWKTFDELLREIALSN